MYLWSGDIKKIFSKNFIKKIFVTLLLDIIEKITNRETRLNIYLKGLNGLIESNEQFLIPSFENGYGKETNRFLYQKQYVDFNIKNGEKVLDIGSGAYPFPLATHLADLYEGETTHRSEPIVKDGRPFQVCNIENLPYSEKEFDFVYCSHILEHVADPAKACREIMRVGRRGYIETPTRMSDIMLNFTGLKDHHKWYVTLAGDSLIFFERPDEERRNTGCNDFFKMLHSKYKNPFQTLVYNNRDLFVNMLLWEDKFYYYVFDKNGELTATNGAYV